MILMCQIYFRLTPSKPRRSDFYYSEITKSPGYDDITNEILKRVHEYIEDPLTHVLNLSFCEGISRMS